MFKKYFLTTIYTVSLMLFFATSAGAVDQLPEVMVGQTTICENGSCDPALSNVYYGGYTGNEAVLNFNQSGKEVGKSLAPSASFNGTNYINAGTAPDITGTGAFAISAWIKRTSGGSDSKEYIFSQANGYYGDIYLFINNVSDWAGPVGSVVFRVAGTSGVDVCSPGQDNILMNSGSTKLIPPSDNTWHHIVVFRDTSGLYGELWIDNVQVATNTGTNLVYVKNKIPDGCGGSSINTRIGSFYDNSYPSGSYFVGNINNVRTYNRALNQAEITSLSAESNNVPTDTKGYWKLNEGSGTTVADSSGNNYTATFNNAAWSEDGPLILDSGTNNELLGFEKDLLKNCSDNGILANPVRCFVLNASSSGVKVMTSRTSINSIPITEVAAIMYPPKMIAGDAYGSFDNFAFWGRSLHQGTNLVGSDAAYKLGYAINENAQASWNGDEFKKNDAKIATLKNEAPLIINSGSGNWYLQSATSNPAIKGSLNDSNQGDAEKTPEGKVWYVDGDFSVNAGVTTYFGTGTIIVSGNLTINNGANIQPALSGKNRLGFIVMGDTIIGGNNKIRAAIYCKGTNGITVSGDNVDLTGSFVASTFGSFDAISNIRFYYDYDLDNTWPPGFRYLNMPHAQSK